MPTTFSLTIFIATVLVKLSLTQLCRNVGSKELGYVPSDVGGSCSHTQLVSQASYVAGMLREYENKGLTY